MRRTLFCIAFGVAAAACSASAADSVSADIDREIVEQGRIIEQDARGKSLSELLGDSKNPFKGKFDRVTQDILGASVEAARRQGAPVAAPQGPDETIYVFLSYSLGDSNLKAILGELAGRENVVAVMRGIPEGEKLQTGIRRMQQLANQFSPAPSVILHPGKFQEFDVETVPTIAYKGRRGDLMVRGLVNIDWFLEQLEKGKQGDLGLHGEVAEIDEPDLIAVMKQRLAAIDLQQQAKDSIETFWTRIEFRDLDEAQTYRRREINPAIVGVRNLATAEGQVFFREGERLNPLDKMPFTQTIFVFDATQEDHLRLVERWRSELPQHARFILIATRLPREDGWESLKKLERRLKHPVFLLSPDVHARFELEYAPAKAYADNDRKVFVVEEIPTSLTEPASNG
jgi:conjugal transfer pilus assembly protein TraW